MKPLHLVLAADGRCVEGCAVALHSVCASTSSRRPLHFHVITNDLAPHQRDLLARTVREAPGEGVITFPGFDPRPVQHLLRSKLITHTAYARLFLDRLLPDEVERCIYLDCDVVVRRDVEELWNTPLDGHTLGAVDNSPWEDSGGHQKRLGLREALYFNSGVLLIDLRRWRETGVRQRSLTVAERMGDRLILHDQDALNGALEGDWLPLPRCWNRRVTEPDLPADSPVVFHYMGWPKPWHADYDGPHGALFLEALDETPLRGWRPWNPLGMGRQAARLRRRFPFLPTVFRLLRARIRPSG
jgi:lipopolysaccharide biosynthesis glycosyltransferase